ncbi:NETI motif-containing protein [Salirhabdus salicampi]|uniref:NETI motif-containing protein n=1 Tax=Salirhabdus salicampi TaxID=476102 RepID=UPI0020C23E84|nr:NETI motif-containing protein [Salirhabdus salicampi]MCP8617847.1 NETI motif-containing protein [Salirhabdus salicampi]
MGKKKKKERFYVKDGETIDQCLERIKKEGYMPVKRLEKPIFQEIKENGSTTVEPVKREIMFEALLMDQE